MARPKRPKVALALLTVGFLMVTAIQMTAANHGDSATIIIGTESYTAECFESGICIIPNTPVAAENLSTLDPGYYQLVWLWHSNGLVWSDVLQINVSDFDCTGHTICKIESFLSAQGANNFKFRCEWDDAIGGWTGYIRINGNEEDCLTANFVKHVEFNPICSWHSEVTSPVSNHFGTGRGGGLC